MSSDGTDVQLQQHRVFFVSPDNEAGDSGGLTYLWNIAYHFWWVIWM